MALGPKQMGEAILRNLKTKTGKELEEWLEIVQASGLTEKKTMMQFLKTDHGLGHFQAQKIFEQFIGQDMYEKEGEFVENLFKTSTLRKLYGTTEETIKTLGEDIRVQPCKTYIPFYRKNQFAILTTNSSEELILGLNLPDDFTHNRFQKAKTPASERINFLTVIKKGSDLDQELQSVIQQSYDLN
ncbi:MAG: DUF5655 domain-containing protein [Bacteroidota bacterium]